MKNILIKIVEIAMLVACIILLFIVDIKEVLLHIPGIRVCKKNLDFINGTLSSYLLIILIIAILISVCIIKNRIAITIPTINVGGVKIHLKNTEKIVRSNMKNYLNTKRTLFHICPEQDNFDDVFSSYHAVYAYIREQMSCFENMKKTDNKCYEKLNEMIVILNKFLTKYQSDYRRWYKKETEGAFKMLTDLQISYPKYQEMIEEFQNLNIKMCSIAKYFSVSTEKWN